MKQIVCLATSPWYPIPTRKQQVMSRMPDAEILYFDPSATIIAPLRDKSTKPLMTAWKEPGEKVRDNITVYRLPPVLPLRVTSLPMAGMVGQATISPVRLGTLATGSASFFSGEQ